MCMKNEYRQSLFSRDNTYGVESKLILFACVDDADLWLEEKTGRLGDAWITWSTRWPTDDGRSRVPSCTNSEFLLNTQRWWWRGSKVWFSACWHPKHAYRRFPIKNNNKTWIFFPQKTIRLQTRCQRCASRLAQRHSDMVKMFFFPPRSFQGLLHLPLKILQIINWNTLIKKCIHTVWYH